MAAIGDELPERPPFHAREPSRGLEGSGDLVVQLQACMHPDCLCAAEVMLEAQWSEAHWRDLDVCTAHIGWAVSQLMVRAGEGVLPQLVSMVLHT